MTPCRSWKSILTLLSVMAAPPEAQAWQVPSPHLQQVTCRRYLAASAAERRHLMPAEPCTPERISRERAVDRAIATLPSEKKGATRMLCGSRVGSLVMVVSDGEKWQAVADDIGWKIDGCGQ